MKHIYIDADQLSLDAIKKLIHQYINFTHRDNAPAAFLHFTFNDHQPKKKQLLQLHQPHGVVGIQVPTKKQAADMVIIAYIQDQLTSHKFQKKELEMALVSNDKTLFSIAELICQRYLVKIEQYDIESVSNYFTSTGIESTYAESSSA